MLCKVVFGPSARYTNLAVKVVTQPGTNLDSYNTEGKYYFSGAVTPVNIPVGINGWLVIYSNGGAIKQIWYRVGTPNANDYDTYVRTCTNGSWGSWSRYLTNADFNPSVSANANNIGTGFEILRYNNTTANGPSAQGVFGVTVSGYILSFAIDDRYASQTAFAVGTVGGKAGIATRARASSGWTEWEIK